MDGREGEDCHLPQPSSFKLRFSQEKTTTMSSFSIPEKYTPMSNTSMTRDVTTFVGIVVTGVLDAQLLQRKTVELIARWPALGGKIITKVLRLECHRFISGCTDPF